MKKTALFLALLLASASPVIAGGDLEKGKEVYQKRCWWCHGESGAGDGPAAKFMNPPPRDFTSGIYKWKSTPFDEIAPTDDDFRRMIKGDLTHNNITGWNGMNGTSMPGWSDMLGDKEVDDLIAYINKFAELEPPGKPAISTSGAVSSSGESIEKGKKVFKDMCSECHGEEGRGNGTKKLKDDWGFRTWPRNLSKAWTFRVGNDPEEVYTRVSVGIPGTQMPSFADPASNKKLSDEDRWNVANYVNSLDAPYKKPTDNTVVKAFRVDGGVPENPDDPAWDNAEYTSLYLVPQMIAKERHFTPSLDSISAKAVYNNDEIAILVEWDDRTKSLPGDAKAIEIADAEVFEDAVAVQWPVKVSSEGDKPYFGMGDASSHVNIWFWQSESGAGAQPTFKLMNSKGLKEREQRDPASAGLKAVGSYSNGTWRVVMKRPLKTGDAEKDIQFEEGKFIPVAFAAWDGSNGEKGPKHEMTTWVWMFMQPKSGASIYIWPVIIALIILGAELIWLKTARKD